MVSNGKDSDLHDFHIAETGLGDGVRDRKTADKKKLSHLDAV